MSDIKERLREEFFLPVCYEAADRIEELEASLSEALAALEPFARAGKLFRKRDPEGYDELVYGPAAGDEYNITGDDLRNAHETVTAIGKK